MIGFVGPKKKTIVGLLIFNPLWFQRSGRADTLVIKPLWAELRFRRDTLFWFLLTGGGGEREGERGRGYPRPDSRVLVRPVNIHQTFSYTDGL